MALKLPFKGSQVQVDTAGGTTFVTIADLAGLQMPQKKRGVAKSTVAESANDYHEYIPSFKDGGDARIRLRFHKTQYTTLDTAFEADTLLNFKFNFSKLTGESTASNFVALGIITDLGTPERSVDGDDVWEVEMTVKLTGKPVFTSGA